MNCLELRRRVGAEPFTEDAEAAAHAGECAGCARYRQEMQAMDGVLARAMRIRAEPEPLARRKPSAGMGPRARRRWLAMAASLVAGVLIAGTLWLSYPEPSLAREVIGHALHEPGSWTTERAVGEALLEEVLGPSRIRLRPGAGTVTYARRCFFEGHWVPHLVVQTAQGPVTVLMLTHREVDAATRVEEQGFAGVVLPAPRGSVAVVGQEPAGLEAVAGQVFAAVDWGA